MSKRSQYAILFFVIVLALVYGNGGGGILPSTRIIDVEGPAVLVVYESGDQAKLPTEQQNIVLGEAWTDLADQYRILDKDVEFTGDTPFKAAFDRPRESLPWCIVSGKRNYEGPLPATVAEMVKLVEAAR